MGCVASKQSSNIEMNNGRHMERGTPHDLRLRLIVVWSGVQRSPEVDHETTTVRQCARF